MSSVAPNHPLDIDALDLAPQRSAAATRLAQVGRTVFGARYHAALAAELKVSRPLLFAMVNDQRRITPEVERRLAGAIRSRIVPQLEAKIEALASCADSIERKLSAYGPVTLEPPETASERAAAQR